MENEDLQFKSGSPDVVLSKSDVANIDTKVEVSNNTTLSVQSEHINSKKVSTPRFKIATKNAKNLPFKVYYPSKNPVVLGELLNEVATTLLRFVIIDAIQADAAGC